MKILFLARLYKPHVGGVEKHVEEISKILSINNEISIITEQHDPKLQLEQTYPESQVYRIPINNSSEKTKKWVIWNWIWHHRNLFNQFEIIHVHDVFYWLLPVLPFITKARIYITFHGYEGDNPPTFKAILMHKFGEVFSWGNICIGNFHKKWYHTVPSIVSFGAVNPIIFSKKNIISNKAIYIGRLAQDTGIMDYLRAALEIKLPMDIYGDGPLREQVAEFIKKNKVPARLLGFVPNAANKLGLYKVAFVSRYLSILEALSNKIPIISHYNNEIKYDYLVDSPFVNYINIANSSDQIVKKLNFLDHSKVENGYNWVKEQTWDKMVKNYLHLWLSQY